MMYTIQRQTDSVSLCYVSTAVYLRACMCVCTNNKEKGCKSRTNDREKGRHKAWHDKEHQEMCVTHLERGLFTLFSSCSVAKDGNDTQWQMLAWVRLFRPSVYLPYLDMRHAWQNIMLTWASKQSQSLANGSKRIVIVLALCIPCEYVCSQKS